MLIAGIALLAQGNRPLSQDPNTRAVHGTVTGSSDGALKGAVVQIEDLKSLQVRSYVTDGDGGYHFAGLSANVDYEIHATHNGRSSGTKTFSQFDGRKDAVVNLKIP